MQAAAHFLASKGGIVLLAFVLLFVLERLFPVSKWLGGAGRVVKNLMLAALNFLASPLIVIPVTAFAAAHAWQWRPEALSGGVGMVLDFLLLDFWIYWWHRANHRWPLLWRFHAVHHLDEMLDTSSALRFHVGEVVLSSLVRAGVIFALAIPVRSVVAFEALIAVTTLFHHSNLRLPRGLERVLSCIIVTPSIHWVHHHAIRRDTDSNYSTVLSIWDRIFRSRSRTLRSVDMPLGVEGRHDKTLAGLVAAPFLPES